MSRKQTFDVVTYVVLPQVDGVSFFLGYLNPEGKYVTAFNRSNTYQDDRNSTTVADYVTETGLNELVDQLSGLHGQYEMQLTSARPNLKYEEQEETDSEEKTVADVKNPTVSRTQEKKVDQDSKGKSLQLDDSKAAGQRTQVISENEVEKINSIRVIKIQPKGEAVEPSLAQLKEKVTKIKVIKFSGSNVLQAVPIASQDGDETLEFTAAKVDLTDVKDSFTQVVDGKSKTIGVKETDAIKDMDAETDKIKIAIDKKLYDYDSATGIFRYYESDKDKQSGKVAGSYDLSKEVNEVLESLPEGKLKSAGIEIRSKNQIKENKMIDETRKNEVSGIANADSVLDNRSQLGNPSKKPGLNPSELPADPNEPAVKVDLETKKRKKRKTKKKNGLNDAAS